MTMILDGTNGAFLPTWTTATRPASPANGQIGYNSTTGQIDQYVGSAWSSVPTAGASQATATALGTVYAKQTTGGGTPFLTAFGYNAGVSTTGVKCVAIGTEALYSNTVTIQQVAIGYQALYSLNTANGNSIVAVGWQAGYSFNSSGSNGAHVYIGASAGYYNVTGIDNTYVGGYAGYQMTSGFNTAVGSLAMLGSGTPANNTGAYNTAVGYQSLYANTSGASNVSMGYGTFNVNQNGSGNTVIGTQAGVSNVSGNFNTYIGYQAGYNGTGSNNIFLCSYYALSATASDSNTILIATPAASVSKGASTGYINPNGGGVYQGNNSSTWSTTSDRRLKKNIVDNTVGLEAINAIQVRNFEYRTEDEVTDLPKHSVIKKQGVQLGVIAQELQQILPDCVKTESTGVMSVDSTDIMWHMINAIKELNAKVIALEARLGA
jgi:hypothetical protein